MKPKKVKHSASQQNHDHTNGNTSSVRSQPKNKKFRSKQKGESQKDSKLTSFILWKQHGLGYAALVMGIAAIFGVLHSVHVSRMFENERFFSHLSTLERELSFRTEMGLYYSYYKAVVEAPTFLTGIHSIMNCNITEYPDKVNTLKRFNLYPEVVLAFGYRMYDWFANVMKIQTKICYTVNRGYDQPPVESCEGLGELSFFYVYGIFYLTGLMMSCFFLLCFYLSGSIFGGIIGVACYFYNHGESTRVMWTPPLRESFSYPFLVLQLLVVTFTIKSVKVDWRHTSLVAVTTFLFMLPWQFAQFALLTQTCALFGLYILNFIAADKASKLLYALLVGHILNFVFQFGNSMLLSSFFLSAVLSSLLVVMGEPYITKLPHQLLIWVVQGIIFMAGTLGIKTGIAKALRIDDDAHIANILRSKFSDYKDFHTSLYTCAPEFDFYDKESPVRLSKTLLLPVSLICTVLVIVKILIHEWESSKSGDKTEANVSDEEVESEEKESDGRKHVNPKPNAELLFHVLQTSAFVLMSVIIMRLKVFGTPALCVLASLAASKQCFGFLGTKWRQAVVVVLLAAMSVQGIANLNVQFNTSGEYNNPAQEELIFWIQNNTPQDAVFSGAMPTMATVKLTTKRGVVNHPHYEDVGIRNRTKNVYQMYSRKPPSVLWETLNSMGVQYAIIDWKWCLGRPKPGCSMGEIWDYEDVANRGRKPCCEIMREDDRPFKRVFKNGEYDVYRLHPRKG